MKRFFALALALLMVLSLAACGEEKRTTKKDRGDKQEATVTVPAGTEAPIATDAPVDNNPDAIFDTDDYALAVTDIKFDDDYYGINIELKAENKTDDEEYTIMVESFYVNGLQTDGSCYIEIADGEVKNENAYVTADFLKMAGIEDVEGFEVTFYIIDDDYDTIDTQTLSYGTNNEYTRDAQSTDQVIVDTDEAKVTIVEKKWEKYSGYQVVVYVENYTDNELYLTIEDITINDTEYETYLGTNVIPGAKTYDYITFYEYEIEEMGIASEADIDEIKFDLVVTDWDEYEDLSTTPVVVKP